MRSVVSAGFRLASVSRICLTVSARFRGVSNKTWSRVKYVLDERKVNKMFNNLERAKSLLANSLHVASRYMIPRVADEPALIVDLGKDLTTNIWRL